MSGDESEQVKLGRRLREARLAKRPKIKVAEVALALDACEATIYRWERGTHEASEEELAKLIALYEVDRAWLLTGLGDSREKDSVSRYLASPVAGVVPDNVADSLRRMPYSLLGYDPPDESDVALVRASVELHFAHASTKSSAGSQPTRIEPPEPPPAAPKRPHKSKRRSG